MQESTLEALEQLFLALSDKTRLRLLRLMGDGEVSVGFLADSLGESQPKVSRHLAYLRNANLVSTRRDGKWIYYFLQRPDDQAVRNILNAILPGTTNRYESDEKNYIYDESYMYNEWRPDELEVFLL